MELGERIDLLEGKVEDMEERVDKLEFTQTQFFNKLFKRLDNLEGKLKKMVKWLYRCLGIIIVLLLIIAIRSPQTASQILSSTGAVIKAL